MNVIVKLLGTGITMGAVFVANKLVSKVWVKATGSQPPKATDDLDNTWKQALAWGMISAFVATVIQVTAGRTTQKAIANMANTKEV